MREAGGGEVSGGGGGVSGLVVSHRRAHGLTATGERLLTLSECCESKSPRSSAHAAPCAAPHRLRQAVDEELDAKGW